MDLPVVNHQDYFANIGDDHKFPINKFGELANYLIKNDVVKKFYTPYPCSEETLMKAHSLKYIRDVKNKTLDQNMVKPGTIEGLTVSRAEKAILAGADGVIASPKELTLLRKNPHCMEKIIVTPGIRPKKSVTNDQKRVGSPFEALKNGASYLVIGRPICQAEDALAAYEEIKTEVSRG